MPSQLGDVTPGWRRARSVQSDPDREALLLAVCRAPRWGPRAGPRGRAAGRGGPCAAGAAARLAEGPAEPSERSAQGDAGRGARCPSLGRRRCARPSAAGRGSPHPRAAGRAAAGRALGAREAARCGGAHFRGHPVPAGSDLLKALGKGRGPHAGRGHRGLLSQRVAGRVAVGVYSVG